MLSVGNGSMHADLPGQRYRRRGRQSAGSRRGGLVADVRDLQGWTGAVARKVPNPPDQHPIAGLVNALAEMRERK